jgi:hypothetical protein
VLTGNGSSNADSDLLDQTCRDMNFLLLYDSVPESPCAVNLEEIL